MRESYPEALRRLLADEGGYSNHPRDPGGPTNFGITIIDYRKYVNPAATAADVKAMKLAEAKTIYRAKYWDALRCDDLPPGVDYAVFDYGVNSGISRAGKVLRRVMGLPDDDWRVSDAVLIAARQREAAKLAAAICDERLAFLKRLATWDAFGVGWGRRVAGVKSVSLRMAGETATAPIPAQGTRAGKGQVSAPEASKHVVKAGGVTGAAGMWAWLGNHPEAVAAVIVVAVVGILAVTYWINRRHQARQDAPTPGIVPVAVTAGSGT